MAIYCGFFNSKGGDRKYQARDMTKPYDLLVSDGVFATPQGTPSNYLQVHANDGMRVRVSYGRGLFFGGMWFVNDADYYLNIDPSEVTLKRIDSVVIRIDENEAVRQGTIYIKKGTPASTPIAPTLERNALVMEYKLANITVDAGVTSITQAKIEDRRAYNEDCGWITSLVKQVDTTTLWSQFDDAFWTWFNDVKEHLSTSTLIRSFTSYYITTVQDQIEIPIQIPQYNYNLDILQPYINNLLLIPELDYTVGDNDKITLINPVDKDTLVSFIVYKSVDGSDAAMTMDLLGTLESDVAAVQGDITELQEDVIQLQADVSLLKLNGDGEGGAVTIPMITDINGSYKLIVTPESSVLETFVDAGVGVHTVYIQNNAIDIPKAGVARAFGHMTTENYGWIMYLHNDGSVFTNYLDNGMWRGWKTLYDANPTALWQNTSGIPMSQNDTITPSKPLSECAHGWELVWGDDSANDEVCTTHIPKRTHKNTNWNGEGVLFGVPYNANVSSGQVQLCGKKLTVTDTTLTGLSSNNVANVSADVRLFRVLEY